MSTATTAAWNDIDAINAAASDEFGDWGPEVTVSQEMINDFAELTGDRQWIHVDVERAKKESPFGGPIAHGFLTLSLVPTLFPPSIALTGALNAVNYGAASLRFISPVPAGSTVQARSRLLEASPHKRGTLITTEVAVHVVDNETPALVYTMLTLYQG